mmetsp:Transcript_9167/g.11761  ORF Transcript_9167/g.11761 Transcript_9167/m.11761 type:complete len:113 (+) Transcript_9167:449-787(+)
MVIRKGFEGDFIGFNGDSIRHTVDPIVFLDDPSDKYIIQELPTGHLYLYVLRHIVYENCNCRHNADDGVLKNEKKPYSLVVFQAKCVDEAVIDEKYNRRVGQYTGVGSDCKN